MAKHCICAVRVQYSYETGHCNCALDTRNSDTREFSSLKSGRAILLDTQNPVYGEAGAQSGRVSAIRDQKNEVALRLVFSKDAVLTGLHCYI
jgi:hypothetical protein